MTNEQKEKRRQVRQMLWMWGSTPERITRLRRELTAAQSWADDARDTLKGMAMDGDGGGGGSKKHDLSDVILRVIKRAEMYDDLVNKIDLEISEAIRIRNTISELYSSLTPIQQKVIAYRYADGHGWNYIALKTTYDERWIRRVEAEAIDFIAERFE